MNYFDCFARFYAWLRSDNTEYWLLFSAVLLSGIVFVSELIFLWVYCKKRRQKRKRERAERARRLQFSLPDKDNSFLRARLNNVLKTPDKDENFQSPIEADGVRFAYVQEMVQKALSAPLSSSDRFDLEETAKLFKAVSLREKWSDKDVRIMNDCCLKTLKVLAKYAL